MVIDNLLIAYVQFEHDGRARATGAFRLPDWPFDGRRPPRWQWRRNQEGDGHEVRFVEHDWQPGESY